MMTFLPEILVALAAIAGLLLDARRTEKPPFSPWIAKATLWALALLAVFFWPHGKTVFAQGMLVRDPFSQMVDLCLYATLYAVLVLGEPYLHARNLWRGEWVALCLFALLGAMVVAASGHLLSLFLGIELMSLAFYGLIAMMRDNPLASEAAMKYFVLSVVATGFLLYGFSLIYGATGTLGISAAEHNLALRAASPELVVLALVFLFAALAFKVGAAPFHMWIPDVYEGSPTAVTALLGVIPKLAALAFFFRLFGEGLSPWFPGVGQEVLAGVAALSVALGNAAAIAQSNIKRMLGYSAIAHAGFFLLAALNTGLKGQVAASAYMTAYVLMNVGAFGVVLAMSRLGFEADKLSDLAGLAKRSPLLAGVMFLLMISLAGIPFSMGFYAKLAVMRVAVSEGYVWLVVWAVLAAALGAYYYLRVVKIMYFDAPSDTMPILLPARAKVILAVVALLVLGLGVVPSPWLDWVEASVAATLR